MPYVIDGLDEGLCSLEELIDGLSASGFHPDNLAQSAAALRRLGNDRNFLADIMVGELANRHREDTSGNAYGAQAFMLSPPGTSNFFLRANIWPSRDEHSLRASGGGAFVYDVPHDHNFHFLTLGYFGPGYWSDYYEYNYEEVAGWRGEPVDLRFIERSRLDQGKVMLYRAHHDVHAQLPPDGLSVSINIMHSGGAQGWMDQYRFDVERREISGILSSGSSEAYLRIAVGLGNADACDLAEDFGRHHPSDRMRLCAWSALAARETCLSSRDAIWQTAEASGSRLVSAEAKQRREVLENLF